MDYHRTAFPDIAHRASIGIVQKRPRFYGKVLSGDDGEREREKFYTRCFLMLLLLYHYVYAGGHFWKWGTVLSAIPCAALFSFRRADRWMRGLHDNRKRFALTALSAPAICAIPHLHTLAVTLAFLLLAAMFYPSSGILAGWQEEETRGQLKENTGTMSEHYY